MIVLSIGLSRQACDIYIYIYMHKTLKVNSRKKACGKSEKGN